MSVEFHLFLPQMRMTMPDLVTRARAAEASGFAGMALMDHLAPPLAETHGMWEAMTTAGWLLSATTTLKLSHLVLCDAFRNPSMLAREAVTLDHASGGRSAGVRSLRNSIDSASRRARCRVGSPASKSRSR
jgi:alkanesulfonate monooxygenase SsuD/methylene tetrahydromethanopterin reductase-like flavin-dependent oxidoreductase (luciferase family)